MLKNPVNFNGFNFFKSFNIRQISSLFRNLRLFFTSIGMEIIFPLGVITLLSFVFDEGHRFISVSPHPFWIVLLPITVLHGLKNSLICATFCSLFLLVGNIPEHNLNEDLYGYFFKMMHKPLLWFVTAFILGELRARQIHGLKDLKKKIVEIEEDKKVLGKAFQNQKKIKEALEIRIVAELRTPSTPLRSVRSMIHSTPEKVMHNFIIAIEELIAPKEFSIFIKDSDSLTLNHKHNWPETSSYKKSFHNEDLLYKEIVGHKRDLCIINETDEPILDRQGILAIPLTDYSKDNNVFAMIKFEKLSFHDLNLSNVEIIRELCQCACKAYGLALQFPKAA